MKLNRNYITPFIALVFAVVGITGLMMLFHIFDGFTEVAHEIMGLLFVVCAIFHILVNWKALKIHFNKGVLLPALLGVLTLTAFLIVMEFLYPPIDLQIIERIVQAPVGDAFRALNIPHDIAAAKLRSLGISVEDADRFEDLWKQTGTDPEKVIDLLLEPKDAVR